MLSLFELFPFFKEFSRKTGGMVIRKGRIFPIDFLFIPKEISKIHI